MQYSIFIKDKPYKPDYNYHIIEECFLPGIIIPLRIEELLTSEWVEKYYPEWCFECSMACHNHPIRPDGSKFCTILFHDAVKPKWKIEDVL